MLAKHKLYNETLFEAVNNFEILIEPLSKVDNGDNEKKEETTIFDFEKKIQDWFANNKSDFIHDFGNTSLSGDKIRSAINYLAPKGYLLQDDVRNILKVLNKK